MLTIAATAWAQDCEPIGVTALSRELDPVEAAFAAGDAGRANELLAAVHRQFPCLAERATTALTARHASLEALAGFVDQDSDRTIRWARAAHWIDPEHAWPAAVGPEHPLRTLVDDEGAASIGTGREELLVPKGGAILLSGREVVDLRVAVEVPLLLQVIDRVDVVLASQWQDGTAFPDELVEGRVKRELDFREGFFLELAGSGGMAAAVQAVDPAGDWLAPVDREGGVGALAITARIPLVDDDVGAFADLRAGFPFDRGTPEGWVGPRVDLGALGVFAGAGAVAATVWEDGVPRMIAVVQPHVGVEGTLDLDGPAAEAELSLGAWPGAGHVRARAVLIGSGTATFTFGLDGGWTYTVFEQPGLERRISVSSWWTGLRLGFAFRG